MSSVSAASFLAALATVAPAQVAPPAGPEVPASRPAALKLSYPGDKDRVIARVSGKDLTLEDLVDHLTRRHAPDMRTFLRTPAGRLYFDSALPALWVRQFADVRALEAEARARGHTLDDAEPFLSAALKSAFEGYLSTISHERQHRGANTKLSQRTVDIYLDKFQRERGLQTEVQGWLDLLVPEKAPEKELYRFFSGHPRLFGGRVTFAHILIRDRDPVTLQLLDETGRRAALARVADVRTRLARDGSNFEDVARALSEDRKTAPRGGIFEDAARFEPSLPAVLCRTAWNLKDGEWTGPVRSRYGLHFVKRISLRQRTFILYTDGAKPKIQGVLRRFRQENLMFEQRRKRRVELLY